jgi:hypothetical protein
LWFDTGSEVLEVAMASVGDTYSAEIPIISSEPLDVFIYANDTDGNIAIRGPVTVTWGGDTSPTNTTTPTSPTTPLTPIDPMIIIVGGIGVFVVLILVVVIIKRK